MATLRSVDAEQARHRVATRIRELSARRKTSLNALADRAGTSPSYLYAVLAGEKSPTVDWLARIAEALRVDIHELLKPGRKGGSGP